jgi:hypothetical protein
MVTQSFNPMGNVARHFWLVLCDLLRAVLLGGNMFKPGDRVRCLASYGNSFTKDKIYVVKKFNSFSKIVMVVTDDEGSITNGWNHSFFELVSDNPEVNSVTIEIPTLVVVHNRDCECGAWAVKDYLHSSWCKMYKES